LKIAGSLFSENFFGKRRGTVTEISQKSLMRLSDFIKKFDSAADDFQKRTDHKLRIPEKNRAGY
jgi:hypothetical protein